MNVIKVDRTIFIANLPKRNHFSATYIPYLLNINHPTINKMWDLYLQKNKVPKKYLPSDKHRLHFESQVLKMIEDKKIIVVDDLGE